MTEFVSPNWLLLVICNTAGYKLYSPFVSCFVKFGFILHNSNFKPLWPVVILTYMYNLDQYQYLGNCPPTPHLTQQQSIDNKLRLMLG